MNPMGGMRSMSVIAGPGGLSRSDCAVLPSRWRRLSRSYWGGQAPLRSLPLMRWNSDERKIRWRNEFNLGDHRPCEPIARG